MLPERLRHVMELLGKLPGVGEKTAQRYALYLASDRHGLATELGHALTAMQELVRPCERCGNLADVIEDHAVCAVCRDRRRESHLLCIVHRVQDLLAIERSGAMRGRYFVLGRLLSPLDGVGPDELPLAELARRVGRPPRTVCELRVSDLVPPEQRHSLGVINGYHVQKAELEQYRAAIDAFLRNIAQRARSENHEEEDRCGSPTSHPA